MQRTWSVVGADCLGTVAVNRCRPVVLESLVQSNQHLAGKLPTDVGDSRGDYRHDPRGGQSVDFTGGGCPVWAERTVTPGATVIWRQGDVQAGGGVIVHNARQPRQNASGCPIITSVEIMASACTANRGVAGSAIFASTADRVDIGRGLHGHCSNYRRPAVRRRFGVVGQSARLAVVVQSGGRQRDSRHDSLLATERCPGWRWLSSPADGSVTPGTIVFWRQSDVQAGGD